MSNNSHVNQSDSNTPESSKDENDSASRKPDQQTEQLTTPSPDVSTNPTIKNL